MNTYDDLLAAANPTYHPLAAATHDNHDTLLAGLALFEAHAKNDDSARLVALSGHTPGSAINSVLVAAQALVEVLAIESKHDIDDLMAALRRQVIKHQVANA